MKATVKQVISDGEWNGKKKWKVTMSDGKTYSTFSDLNSKLNQEIEFEGTQNKYGWRMKVTKQGMDSQGKGGFQRPATDPKTMWMSYSKDIVVAMIETKMVKDGADAQKWLLDTYDMILHHVKE